MPVESTTLLAHPRRPAGRRGWVAAALVLLVTAALPFSAAADDALRCTLTAPAKAAAGGPVMLQFTVANQGTAALDVLQWNTPFEGWFGAYVRVLRDGAELPYRGPQLKRGDPRKSAYFRLRAGQSRSASVDLALPFDLTQPGHYRVEPQLMLFDVAAAGQGAIPRPRDQHAPRELACNAVEIVIAGGLPK